MDGRAQNSLPICWKRQKSLFRGPKVNEESGSKNLFLQCVTFKGITIFKGVDISIYSPVTYTFDHRIIVSWLCVTVG